MKDTTTFTLAELLHIIRDEEHAISSCHRSPNASMVVNAIVDRLKREAAQAAGGNRARSEAINLVYCPS